MLEIQVLAHFVSEMLHEVLFDVCVTFKFVSMFALSALNSPVLSLSIKLINIKFVRLFWQFNVAITDPPNLSNSQWSHNLEFGL